MRCQDRRILFSFDYPPFDGGVARLCAEVGRGLARRGLRVRVLSQDLSRNPRGSDGPAPPDLPETRVTCRRPLRELAATNELRRLPRGTHVVAGVWYPEGLIATLAGMRPLVVLAHGSELMPTRERWRRGIWRRLMRRVLERANLVVANSAYTLGLVKAAAPGARAVAIPLAVDHERFSPGDREAARSRFGVCGKLVISTVSRICAYKGHDVVFRALASLPVAERERFLYLVAGQGPDRPALEAEARRLGVAGQVKWLGFVEESALPDLYRASDLFVLCTREASDRREVEGFGLVFAEAQACGTPVVGTRTGGIPDAVREGEGGWLIPQDDAAALADILSRLADAPDEFISAGGAARLRVERELTWDRYIARLVGELESRGIRLG